MQYIKYILIACAITVLRIISKHDEILSTPYIIKTVAMILLLAVGIGMLVKDVKTNRTISKKE